MMIVENSINVDVMVYSTNPAKALPSVVQAEAERIALAAAVDALRGPKAGPPANCAYCVRRALERMGRNKNG